MGQANSNPNSFVPQQFGNQVLNMQNINQTLQNEGNVNAMSQTASNFGHLSSQGTNSSEFILSKDKETSYDLN